MKVELTKNWELMITPETAVEGIALEAWSTKYHVINQPTEQKESPAATLLIGAFGTMDDRLYRTAQTLVDFYDLRGPSQFKMRFGTLDILDVCRQIVAEGEGNPHPWPASNPYRSDV